MNILITGGTGFVGSHMVDYILKYAIRPDQKVYCTKRWMEDTKNLDHIDHDSFEYIDCDLLDGMSVKRAVEISKPEKVFHFAAQSFPEVSFKTPVVTLQTNIIGTTHLLESIKESEYDPTIVSVSSSEVYGNPNEDEIPITEENPIRPANPYSISKVGHDLMSQYYHKAYGMKIITTRMFSHEGARRGKQFALSSFAYQIAKNEKLKGDGVVKHGNLDSVRTYNHIEDAIQAIHLLKDAGLKVQTHWMPNLPGATPELDIAMFDRAIYSHTLQSDDWKIYPTIVTKTSDRDNNEVYTVIEKWYNE